MQDWINTSTITTITNYIRALMQCIPTINTKIITIAPIKMTFSLSMSCCGRGVAEVVVTGVHADVDVGVVVTRVSHH
jgi:hypothetical protein